MTVEALGNKRRVATKDGSCGEEENYYIKFVHILAPMTRDPMIRRKTVQIRRYL